MLLFYILSISMCSDIIPDSWRKLPAKLCILYVGNAESIRDDKIRKFNFRIEFYYCNGKCRFNHFIDGIRHHSVIYDGADTYVVHYSRYSVKELPCSDIVIWKGVNDVIKKNAEYFPILCQSLVCEPKLSFVPSIENVTAMPEASLGLRGLRFYMINTNVMYDVHYLPAGDIVRLVCSVGIKPSTMFEMSASEAKKTCNVKYFNDTKVSYRSSATLEFADYPNNDDGFFAFNADEHGIVTDYRHGANAIRGIVSPHKEITRVYGNNPLSDLESRLSPTNRILYIFLTVATAIALITAILVLWHRRSANRPVFTSL